MIRTDGSPILEHLAEVSDLRQLVAGSDDLRRRVAAVKSFQHSRFAKTYEDLLAAPDYVAATRFFLDKLYGPVDFTERDAQFARIVPALVRLFPRDVVSTVQSLAELHALSERLDVSMAQALDASDCLDGHQYGRAWQLVGRAQDRGRQISLVLSVGNALVRYTRNPFLRHSLRVMRQPARASGLGVLQSFLEAGFETFGAMPNAQAFLTIISSREHRQAQELDEWDGASRLSEALESTLISI